MFGMYLMNDELEVVSEKREDELWWFTICVSRLKFANCEFSVQYLRSPSHTSPSQSPDCPPKVKSSFIFPSTAVCRSQYRLFEEYVIPQRQEQIEFCLSYIPLFVFIFSPSSIYLPRGFWRESVRSVGLMQGQRVVWSQQGSWVTCLPSALSSPLLLARDAPHAAAAHLKFNSWVQISATGCSCLWPSYPLTMRPTHASLAAVTPAHCCQSMYEHLDVWTDRRLAFSPGVSASTQIRCLHLAPSPLVISESSDLGCND